MLYLKLGGENFQTDGEGRSTRRDHGGVEHCQRPSGTLDMAGICAWSMSGALAAAAGAGLSPITATFLPNAGNDLGQRAEATLIQATIGGLASVAGGGKFANGAITGAFQYLARTSLEDTLKIRQIPLVRRCKVSLARVRQIALVKVHWQRPQVGTRWDAIAGEIGTLVTRVKPHNSR